MENNEINLADKGYNFVTELLDAMSE